MIEHTRTRPLAGRTKTLRNACAIVLLLMVGACARSPFGPREATAPGPVPANAVVGNDPVVAFAAGAQPGAGGRVTLANGQPATVRVNRAYHSANGRECREILVGSGMAERQRLVCATEAGWAEVRPLLRGGGTIRP